MLGILIIADLQGIDFYAVSCGINWSRHGPLLLDRSVCLPLFPMWPSFGYFSTVI